MMWLAIGLGGAGVIIGAALFARSRRTPAAAVQRKIVIMRPGATLTALTLAVTDMRGAVREELPLVNGVACELPKMEGFTALAASEEVLRIDDDIQVQAIETPPDADSRGKNWWWWRRRPTQTVPWGVSRIGASQVWPQTRGDGVKVAVMDTGISMQHPDLVENTVGGVNLVDAGRPPIDDNGHGTHVAGTIAAADNAEGVVGVAPKARLYAVKILDRNGSGYLSTIISGLQWCVANGIKVVNMSFGASQGNETFAEAVRLARQAGLIMVAAAGNSGPGADTVGYPARYPDTIAVAAMAQNDQIAQFSSRGPEVDVTAPGEGINSTWLGDGYRLLSGTSMATPHVAGLAALVVAAAPGLSSDGIRAALEASTSPLPGATRDEQGAGLVNAPRALAAAVAGSAPNTAAGEARAATVEP